MIRFHNLCRPVGPSALGWLMLLSSQVCFGEQAPPPAGPAPGRHDQTTRSRPQTNAGERARSNPISGAQMGGDAEAGGGSAPRGDLALAPSNRVLLGRLTSMRAVCALEPSTSLSEIFLRLPPSVIHDASAVLGDPLSSRCWPAVLRFVGVLGGTSEVEMVKTFILQGTGERVTKDAYVAVSVALEALAQISALGGGSQGTEVAAAFLIEATEPTRWQRSDFTWNSSARLSPSEVRSLALRSIYVLGRAHPSTRARHTLKTLAAGDQSMPATREAIHSLRAMDQIEEAGGFRAILNRGQ